MSNQVYAGPNRYYYLSSNGVDKIYFNEDAAPPLGILDKHLLYVLTDDKLYYDGNEVAVSGSTVANALKTTGANVTVSAAAPPSTGQVLKATSATNATWQNDEAVSLKTTGASVNVSAAAPPSVGQVLKATSATTATWQADTAGGNVSSSITSQVNEIATYTDTSGENIGNSNFLLTLDDSNIFMNLSNVDVSPASVLNSTVIGIGNCSSATDINGSFVAGTRHCDNLATISNSIFIGDAHLYQGAVGKTSDGNVIVGSGFGSNGGFDTASGNVGLGLNCYFFITTGDDNVAIGNGAMISATTATNNVCIGVNAGANLTSGNGNIYISNNGVAAESDTIRIGTNPTKTFIAGIAGATTVVADAIPVLISASTGQLGTVSSSIKYKMDVEDLKGSELIYDLNPVSFRYIQNGPESKKSIGLIAEEVSELYPDMVIHKDDEILTLDYNRLPILLLAEIKKLNKRIEKLEAHSKNRNFRQK